MNTPSQGTNAQNLETTTLKADLSHRLGLLDSAPLDCQLIDSLHLMLDRAETTLTLLCMHYENGNDPQLCTRTVTSAIYTALAEFGDMHAVIDAYCTAANAADKQGGAV